MEIIVNGTTTHTDASTLAAFVAEQQLATAGVAIALEGRVVRRADWEQTPLHEGASLMLIRATQGG